MEQESVNKELNLYMNGQIVELKNPGTSKGAADFLKLMRYMGNVRKNNPDLNDNQVGEVIMGNMDDDTIQVCVRLVNATLEKTFPTLSVEERESWGMENFMALIPRIIQICSPKQSRDEKSREELMKRMEAQKA